MTVYKLVKYYNSFGGEGISVKAIFSTKEKAEDYIKKYNYPIVNNEEGYTGCWGKYEIIPTILDDTSENDEFEEKIKKRKR